MSELVLLHHNEPMTTSLAIAAGVNLEHKSVLQLLRKYIGDLQKLGEVAFQTRLEIVSDGTSAFEMRKSAHRPTEFAYLNEGQSIFLLTLMRNTEKVVAFKLALVQAFLELRDRLRVAAPQFTTRQLDHGADLAVAADRTFRSFMRAARSAGLPLPAALRVANQQTMARTGMDMLAELGVDQTQNEAVPSYDPYGVAEFVALWLADELPVPATHCRSPDLYAAYTLWRREDVAPINVFGGRLLRADARLAKRIVWIRRGAANERENARAIILPWLDNYGTDRAHLLAEAFDRFTAALADWKAQ